MPKKPNSPAAAQNQAPSAGLARSRQSARPATHAAPAKAAKPAARAKPLAPAAAAKAPSRKSAGRPRAAEVEARLDELKLTAAKLFLCKGYSNVSLDSIAREARVAVRTIYVKFGGKTGLLAALLQDKREEFFANIDMDKDERPLKEVLKDFARRMHTMITTQEAVALQRMLAAEASSNPELVETFYAGGPNITREAIHRFLNRPDIRVQLRDDLPEEQIPVFLLNCILGDSLARLLRNGPEGTPEQRALELEQRMELFFRAVLR